MILLFVTSTAPLSPEMANYVLVSLLSFLVGIVSGWYSAKRLDGFSDEDMRRVITMILIISYAVSIFAEIFITGYHTPILLHAIIGGIIGYMFSIDEDGFNINIGGRK